MERTKHLRDVIAMQHHLLLTSYNLEVIKSRIEEIVLVDDATCTGAHHDATLLKSQIQLNS